MKLIGSTGVDSFSHRWKIHKEGNRPLECLAPTIHEDLFRRPTLSPGGLFSCGLLDGPPVHLRRPHVREAPADFSLKRLATAFIILFGGGGLALLHQWGHRAIRLRIAGPAVTFEIITTGLIGMKHVSCVTLEMGEHLAVMCGF